MGGRASWYNMMMSPTHSHAYFSPGTEMCGHGLCRAFSPVMFGFVGGEGCLVVNRHRQEYVAVQNLTVRR